MKPKAPTRKEMDASYTRQLQVDLEEDIALAVQLDAGATISGQTMPSKGEVLKVAPASCPACGARCGPTSRGFWLHLSGDPPRLQCSLCAHIVEVTGRVWLDVQNDHRVRIERHREIHAPKPRKVRRERGAE